jgi:NAD(P)-dependent dehydrogenase (short-subunit alcohol dehydrogenase family)
VIIATTSIQADDPSADLCDYALTKAATMNFVKSLAKQLGPKGIRVCVRPALVNVAHSIHEKQIILLIRAGVYSRLRSAAQLWSPAISLWSA